MSYTLDDVHEALGIVFWYLSRIDVHRVAVGLGVTRMLVPARFAIQGALDALEAELPEPCDQCGSDQCGWVLAADASDRDRLVPRLVRGCLFLSSPPEARVSIP